MTSNRPEGRQEFSYVNSNEQLVQSCELLSETTELGFDSEFIRTNTYFPKPGLFQLTDGRSTFLVDPLAIDSWDSLKSLLGAASITVIMHSSSEDLGLLGCFLNTLPVNLFDTQRAAAFVGDGYSLSYQALVKTELGIEIPKGETRSDWLRRPLSERQLEYAALDVEYLVPLRELLVDRLQQRGMLEWFEQDCRDLLNSVPDELDPTGWETAYQAIGSAWQLDQGGLGLLQKLAYWREKESRRRDKPRNWIVKDQELIALAERLPSEGGIDEADIRRAGVFSDRFLDREARQLARFLNQFAQERSFAVPASQSLLSRPLGGKARRQLKALQKLSREKAAALSIAPELLARKRLWVELLEKFARGEADYWPAGLNNWRRELLEPGVESILASGSADRGD